MLKCSIFAKFLDFENGCCYIYLIACRRRKTHEFLVLLFKNLNHFIDLSASLSYNRVISKIMRRKCDIRGQVPHLTQDTTWERNKIH